MARIIFLNRFFYPDLSATSQLLGDLAFHLARRGEEVHVVTARRTSGESARLLPVEETVNGVVVHRLRGNGSGGKGLSGRALEYVAFYASAAAHLTRRVGLKDILIAKTDPPLLSILGASVARRAKVINWLQDLYPDVAIELGVPLLGGAGGKALIALRNRSLRRAAMNVTIGDRMAERLMAGGIPAGSVTVIPNWTDDERIVPLSAESNPLRRKWGLAADFVVGYSGNLGRAHEIETLLGAAELLRSRREIKFLFVGSGHLRSRLDSIVKARGLTSFFFKPHQPRDMLPVSLTVPDVHWISLRPTLEGLIVPSKLYGIAAAGRPILVVAAADGELAELVTRHKAGIACAVGDAAELAGAIRMLADDPTARDAMGRNARRMLDEKYTRAEALRRWTELISTVAA